MAHVVSIVYTPRDVPERKPQDRYARVSLQSAKLVEGGGIAGDAKGTSATRQLNIMFAESLAELAKEGFKTAPGEMGEQIVVAGLDPATIVEGTRLKFGEAIVDINIPRTGCDRFEMIQGKPRLEAKGRLGMIATVVSGGEIAVGDAVEFLPAS